MGRKARKRDTVEPRNQKVRNVRFNLNDDIDRWLWDKIEERREAMRQLSTQEIAWTAALKTLLEDGIVSSVEGAARPTTTQEAYLDQILSVSQKILDKMRDLRVSDPATFEAMMETTSRQVEHDDDGIPEDVFNSLVGMSTDKSRKR